MRNRLIAVAALMAYAAIGAAFGAQEPNAAGFEQALVKARVHPVQWDTPGDPERAIALYDQVLAAYPKHPRISEVKLDLLTLLTISLEVKHLERANGIVKDLVRSTEASTTLGYNARIKMVYFQVDKSRHQSFEDLPSAWAVLGELEKAWGKKSVEWANIVRYRARLLRREGRPLQALIALSDYYRQTYEWPKEHWTRLKQNDPEQYRAFRQMFQLLNNEVVMALGACKGPEAFRVMRSAHPGFKSNIRVMRAWKEYQRKYILGEDETFEGMRRRIYKEGMKRLDANSPSARAAAGASGASSQPSQAPSRSAVEAATRPSDGPTAEDNATDTRNAQPALLALVGVLALVAAGAACLLFRQRKRRTA